MRVGIDFWHFQKMVLSFIKPLQSFKVCKLNRINFKVVTYIINCYLKTDPLPAAALLLCINLVLFMLSHDQTDFFQSYTRDYKIPRVIVVKQQIESRGKGGRQCERVQNTDNTTTKIVYCIVRKCIRTENLKWNNFLQCSGRPTSMPQTLIYIFNVTY